MLLTFTFTVDPEHSTIIYAGNMELQQALNLLQQIIIADAVNKARELDKKTKDATIKEWKDAPS